MIRKCRHKTDQTRTYHPAPIYTPPRTHPMTQSSLHNSGYEHFIVPPSHPSIPSIKHGFVFTCSTINSKNAEAYTGNLKRCYILAACSQCRCTWDMVCPLPCQVWNLEVFMVPQNTKKTLFSAVYIASMHFHVLYNKIYYLHIKQ